MKDDDFTQKIIGCAYKVHNSLASGFLEKVYENALRIYAAKKKVDEQAALGVGMKEKAEQSIASGGDIYAKA